MLYYTDNLKVLKDFYWSIIRDDPDVPDPNKYKRIWEAVGGKTGFPVPEQSQPDILSLDTIKQLVDDLYKRIGELEEIIEDKTELIDLQRERMRRLSAFYENVVKFIEEAM